MAARLLATALLAAVFHPITAYIESVAANVDGAASGQQRDHINFVPLVAFNCGYRNKYMTETGHWIDDASRYATCFQGKLDILKYCKKVYPRMDITNIVEYSHETKMDDWCREEGTPCKNSATVRPYHCIVGEFRSEALQVPHGCRFGHVNDRKSCDDYSHWERQAYNQCDSRVAEDNKEMVVRSFAVLEPCGLDLFTGVEFVCCPGSAKKIVKQPEPKKLQVVDKATQTDMKPRKETGDETDDTYYEDEDNKSKAAERSDAAMQDPYFREIDPVNEHEKFKDAEARLNKKHRDKIAKVMHEWAELDKRYVDMAKKDPKGANLFKQEMTSRFQKTVASLEEENKEQKKQLEDMHDERVQAHLNERKRQATHDYRSALAVQVGTPNKHNVLKTLKAYIRAEEKDRTHMLNRYRHLLRTDTVEAKAYRSLLIHRLRFIDLRINGTLAMLRDFTELERQVRPIAVEFWTEYRLDNTPELAEADEWMASIGGDESKNENLVNMYQEHFNRLHPSTTTTTPKSSTTTKKASIETDNYDDDDDDDDEDEDDDEDGRQLHVEIEPIVQGRPSYSRHSPLRHDQSTQTDEEDIIAVSSSSHSLLLTATGIVLVLAVIVLALRRRRTRSAGFIKVDVCTPEERHVSGMQVNGYANPTYSFFDAKA